MEVVSDILREKVGRMGESVCAVMLNFRSSSFVKSTTMVLVLGVIKRIIE